MNAISGTRRTMKEMADGTIRVQIDIDPPCRSDFLALFPNIDMPVAIAPLRADFEQMTPEPQAHPGERASGLWLLAVQWCKEQTFWEWIYNDNGVLVRSENEAAEWIKHELMIASRKELNVNRAAIAEFNQVIRGPYMQWMSEQV